MIEDMAKLRIVGPKSIMPDIISELDRLKVFHIVEKSVADTFIGDPLPSAESISGALIKIRAISSQLGIKKQHSPPSKTSVKKIIAIADSLAAKVKACQEGIKAASATEKKYKESLIRLNVLRELNLKEIPEYDTLECIVGFIRRASKFSETLKEKTDRFIIKKSSVNGKEIIALFIDKDFLKEARPLLQQFHFGQIESVRDDKIEVLKSLAEAKKRKRDANQILDLIKKEYGELLPPYEQILSHELSCAEAPLRFKQTNDSFLIYGFVPKKGLKPMTGLLQKKAANKLVVEEQAIEKDDKVPIELSNPKQIKDFEFFLSLYSLPKYKEIDPSWLLFLTFPLLFGFMLGDIGYGLVTALLFLLLKARMPKFAGFFNILVLSSISSFIFGFVFGEFFGFELYHPLINRSPEHGLEPLMFTAIIMGVIHVNIGLLVGFLNEYRAHGFKKAFYEKCSWILLEIAVVLIGLSYAGWIELSPIAGFVMLTYYIWHYALWPDYP